MEQFKVGDIVLFYEQPKLSFWDSLFVMKRYTPQCSGMGIVVNIYGESFVVKFTEHEIILDNFYGGNRVKILTPKKPYSKDEQEKLSKICIQEYGKFVEDYYTYLNFSEIISEFINIVRPKTVDVPGTVTVEMIELNRYYKLVKDLEE